MNILYIGSAGALSLLPFKKLQTSEHVISAAGVFSPIKIDNRIIALENESLALAANQSDIPVIDLSQPVADTIAQCSSCHFDVILMSCYGKRLSKDIIGLAEKGCYNMHPSLLPRFRGPEPVFWQMKQASDMGVSWHQVVHEFDAGHVVAQQKVVLDDGADYTEICLQLAGCGVDLMMELLSNLENDRLKLILQNPDIASYNPYPAKYDFVIDDNFTARQLYNFMRATRAFLQPYLYKSGNLLFYLDEALDFENNITLETVEIQGNRIHIPCNEGVLIARYIDKMTV